MRGLGAPDGLWESMAQRHMPKIQGGQGSLSLRDAEFVMEADLSGLARRMLWLHRHCGNASGEAMSRPVGGDRTVACR
jgi:hypothetical protein